MAWTHVADTRTVGVFMLRLDGRDAGTLSLLDDVGSPTVRAGLVVAALNEFDAKMSSDVAARYITRGWPSRDAYTSEVDVNRLIVADQAPEVRAEIETAFHRASYPPVLTPSEMWEWQSTIEAIIAAHQIDGAA